MTNIDADYCESRGIPFSQERMMHSLDLIGEQSRLNRFQRDQLEELRLLTKALWREYSKKCTYLIVTEQEYGKLVDQRNEMIDKILDALELSVTEPETVIGEEQCA